MPSTVFVPLTAPAVKVAALGKVGAAVVQEGTEYVDAYQRAMDFVAASGALYCHAYDQPEIAAGAGTISLELEEQLDGVDTVLVAVGGGVESVLVSDEQIAAARIFLWENYRIVLENGAAAAYAALQSGAYVPRSDERVAVILCGANTDPAGL
ncbi:threonine dehydratase [Arthrobacter sp. UYCu511]